MKCIKTALFAGILSLVFLLTVPTNPAAWAASGTLWQIPGSISVNEAGFRLEAPSNISDRAVKVSAEALDPSKLPPAEDFFVTRAVNIEMFNVDKVNLNWLAKPVRLVFSFDGIDHKRASRLNTSQPLGYFRIGYCAAGDSNWVELPSQVFWNGIKGAVEAETTRGTGRYALLWSYQPGTQLSPIARGIRLMVNNVVVQSELPPYINGGRTMVPLRVVAENLGARVEWDAAEKRIDLIRNVDKIQLWIDKQTARVKGETLLLVVPPEIKGERTFVPLRFAAEALGATVTWDDLTQTAGITR
ncbi:MAG: hypothetical protein BWY80_01200 [Firmicutes bacterium ADurb.Bin456]|nr:MAG: hypothetical protein BWY80_01200 [Firmicutes bacterium ADurb.Bin456]